MKKASEQRLEIQEYMIFRYFISVYYYFKNSEIPSKINEPQRAVGHLGSVYH